MPTILVQLGWRLFFYANEGNEPIHVHCRKGDIECKYWIDEDSFDIQEAYSYGMSPRDNKQIRKIIFEHFEYIVEQWKEFQVMACLASCINQIKTGRAHNNGEEGTNLDTPGQGDVGRYKTVNMAALAGLE